MASQVNNNDQQQQREKYYHKLIMLMSLSSQQTDLNFNFGRFSKSNSNYCPFFQITINSYYSLLLNNTTMFELINPNISINSRSREEWYNLYITQSEFIDNIIDALHYDNFKVMDQHNNIKRGVREYFIGSFISKNFDFESFVKIIS
jgi:hypothetical protein